MASFFFSKSIKKLNKLLPKTHPLNTLQTYLLSSICNKTNPHLSKSPPIAKKVKFKATAHGVYWDDPYHWMSNTHDPDFINYIHNENSYSEAFMADTRKIQSTLFSEMINRLPEKISTPPERWGPWLYYQYIPEIKEYPVLCRKLAVESTNWVKHMLQFFLISLLAGYVHVGTCRVSPDHRFLAYTIDKIGDERFLLRVKDIQNGTIIAKFN